MKTTRALLLASILAVLGGCVVAPIDPGYYGGAPGYYAPPAYYGPSIGIGIYGGRRGGYGGGYGRGYRYR